MGRGVNVKRRASGKKVSRRVRRDPTKINVAHGGVKADWQKGTVLENYKALGICANPNSEMAKFRPGPARFRKGEKLAKEELKQNDSPLKPSMTAKQSALVAKWSECDQDTLITGRGLTAARRAAFHMSEEECLYIKPLVDAYGEDFDAMFKDIRLNFYQYSKGQLQRLGKRFMQYSQTEACPIEFRSKK
mmetsp:Transcript_16969/g.29997  ORF Transcript_16969/g.29997 Transcript_16969/m.29997 type:complete len:190 (+) Transcript_16969:170-739(+)